MRRFIFTSFCFLFFAAALSAQAPTPIYIGDDAPPWMHMMQAEQPDVFAIQKAYKDWFAARPFEKNSYTNYYKRWMRWARPFAQADGSLHLPAPAQDAAKEKKVRAQRAASSALAARRRQKSDWTFVGPKQTYHTDGQTVVTWQTNIYCFDISTYNPGILYAGGESGGLWKTTDKGMNWTLLTTDVLHDAFNALIIHPDNPNIVFAGTRGKIIKTTDGGATWTTVYSAGNLRVNEFAYCSVTGSGEIFLAATSAGILRTVNGGNTWNQTSANETWTIKTKTGDLTTVFAIRKNGSSADFLRSTNGGNTWTALNSGLYAPQSGEAVTGAIIALCPSKPEQLYSYFCGSGSNLAGYIGVFKSTDGGSSWSNTNPSGAIGNSPTPYSVPAHANIMASNGTTGLQQGFYDMAIVVNPANSEQLIAGGTSWFRSNDGGRSWTGLGSYIGGLSWSHPDIQWCAASGNDLWIASDGGLNYSTDWATTIEARMNGISGSDMWGFDAGWNEDILVGGRYHNGNMAYYQNFPEGKFYRMGGAESATGYVNPGPERKVYHSDIGGHIIKGDFAEGVTRFPVGTFPNESYAYYANSEMEWHPRCWNIVFLGKENKLWKSTDGGASFQALYTFPGDADNEVYEIEICRAQTDRMYCSQYDGTDDAIWRSADGGQSWTKCAPLPLPNNNDRVKLAVSDRDPDVLWAAVTYGSNGRKIYKTTDGGQSWINLTTSLLDGVRVSNIMAQYGTDDGIYLGTDFGVYYRNNSHSDWQPYAEGLPLSAETNRLKPFYKEGKIRNGCWGFGVWEAPLFEPSTPQALIMANMLESDCPRDTFQFDDHSAVLHAGAQWQWSFPGASWMEGADSRSPRAAYAQAGTYPVYMTLTTPVNTTHDTLFIKTGNACDRDTVPGEALFLDGSSDYAGAAKALNLNTNTLTMTAWIKQSGAQDSRAAIVFCRGNNTTAGLGFDGDRLSYHWDNSYWWWNSGLTPPKDEWVHVALVVEPDRATIYMNGFPSVNQAAHAVEPFDAPLLLGLDPNGGDRYFSGWMDEVCVYNRALSQAEIREQMHLTKGETNSDGLVAYYQFNENGGQVFDRIAVGHLGLNGDAVRASSSAPVGKGASFRNTMNGAGLFDFPGTDLSIQTKTGTMPNGEICITKIENLPDALPTDDPTSEGYWVLRNYGANATFNDFSKITFRDTKGLPTYPFAEGFHLYKRAPNGEGDTWIFSDRGDKLDKHSLVFSTGNGINSAVQFIVSAFPPKAGVSENPRETRVSTAEKLQNDCRIKIFPNPVKHGAEFTVQTNLKGNVKFKLYNERGQAVRLANFENQTSLTTKNLTGGVYIFSVENDQFIQTGSLIITDK